MENVEKSSRNKIDFKLLILSIVVCIAIGSSGSVFTVPKITTWYSNLNKPWFTPPSWAFSPIWFSLFTLMGISLYMVLRKGIGEKRVKIAVGFFSFQFALNVLWSFLFFGLESPLFGLIGIIALWLAILATIIKFYSISRKAAYLLIPYIVWVSIATALNYAVLVLN